MRVHDQQDDEENIEKERADGADQGLIVNRLDEYHVSDHKQQWEKTCEYVQKANLPLPDSSSPPFSKKQDKCWLLRDESMLF